MTTNEMTTNEITKKIQDRIRVLVPGYVENNHGFVGDGNVTDAPGLSINIAAPRAYMGRVDYGKLNWTIDVRGGVKRPKQVRIAVTETTATFDESKLLEHVRFCRAALKSKSAAEELLERNEKQIPKKLPRGMWVRATANGYDIEYRALGDLDFVRRVVEALATVKKV